MHKSICVESDFVAWNLTIQEHMIQSHILLILMLSNKKVTFSNYTHKYSLIAFSPFFSKVKLKGMGGCYDYVTVKKLAIFLIWCIWESFSLG